MSQQGSNLELFAHENDALTARPQLHNIVIIWTIKKILYNYELYQW